jgi:hypothetical protein
MWVYLRDENGSVGHDPSIWLVTETVLLASDPRQIKIKDLCNFLNALLTPVASLFYGPSLHILSFPYFQVKSGTKPLLAGGACYLHVLGVLRQGSPSRVRSYASRS